MASLSYCNALKAALLQEMTRDPGVFLIGPGLGTRDAFFQSIAGIPEQFPGRVIDAPVAEDALTGFCLGAAINGQHPILHHIRADFGLLGMNQLLNMIAPHSWLTLGEVKVPLVIRMVIGRSWGQGHQHSKSLPSWFAHVPGLKVVLPTTPADAKGLLAGAIRDGNPVVFLEHRWLYWGEGQVPEGELVTPLYDNPGEILREGTDVTIVAFSWMAVEAIQAAEIMQRVHGVSCEVVNPKVVSPFDMGLILQCVAKTGGCLVVEPDWVPFGLGAEVLARLSENYVKLAVSERIGWAHTPCPTARHQEEQFYPSAHTIVQRLELRLGLKPCDLSQEPIYSNENVRKWRGPF